MRTLAVRHRSCIAIGSERQGGAEAKESQAKFSRNVELRGILLSGTDLLQVEWRVRVRS